MCLPYSRYIKIFQIRCSKTFITKKKIIGRQSFLFSSQTCSPDSTGNCTKLLHIFVQLHGFQSNSQVPASLPTAASHIDNITEENEKQESLYPAPRHFLHTKLNPKWYHREFLFEDILPSCFTATILEQQDVSGDLLDGTVDLKYCLDSQGTDSYRRGEKVKCYQYLGAFAQKKRKIYSFFVFTTDFAALCWTGLDC